jgi:hypothetical protein
MDEGQMKLKLVKDPKVDREDGFDLIFDDISKISDRIDHVIKSVMRYCQLLPGACFTMSSPRVTSSHLEEAIETLSIERGLERSLARC